MVHVKKFLRNDYQSEGQLFRAVKAYVQNFDGYKLQHDIEVSYFRGRLKHVFVMINYKNN